MTIDTQPGTISLDVIRAGTGYPAGLFVPSKLRIAKGKTTVLVGASGSGKSTLLRLLAGLETAPPDTFRLNGLSGSAGRAYMTQDVRLLPWFTVEANVGIGNRLRGHAPDRAGVAKALEQLDLTRDAHKYPSQISGGMAQRAALARTLLERADLNLLDEPFAALDAITRRNMQDLVKRHFAGKTVVMVTHDPVEAVRLGDAVFMLAQADPGGAAEIRPFRASEADAPARAERLFNELLSA